MRNGYSKSEIKKARNPKRTRKEEPCTEKAYLPYIKSVTDRVARILRKHQIKIVFKPTQKIKNLLRSAKDKRDLKTSAGQKFSFACPCYNYTRTNQLVKKIDTLEEIIQNLIAENLKITTMLEKIHCKDGLDVSYGTDVSDATVVDQETRQNNDSHEKHQDKTPRKVDVSKNCTKIFQPDSKKSDAQRQRRRTRNKGRTAVFGNGDEGKSNITAVKRKTWAYVGRIAPATGVRGMKNHCEAVFPGRAVEIELLPQWKISPITKEEEWVSGLTNHYL
nr:unnamed protein product [Callosobruchus analis]